ncbi:ATP-binding cassette domain-containing protein [Paraglaciecola aquimarina]|uniref:ATP-binding cassette domain-containing protein n=1 Tax=Paraglaciecola aquimarina TaxID=1235557 RepID=A0ABU3T033_9ALTE|nr:ATP-binding cassette domain-containing protein [Paraglaciecola aquimarina]MDU0355624.1 ATP-binding cassette domain-containing protein [Paraglaciecola aquimarina]
MIEIKQLAKKFALENPKKLSDQEKKDPRLKGRFFHSVKEVSFACGKGQVLGLLGPNGAGKTTTLRMLSTALKPDSGSVFIAGENVLENPLLARRKIGFLSGTTGLYGRLTGRENIQYFARLHGLHKSLIDMRIQELAELLDMHSFLDRRSEHFSTGMKQKTAIARAVIHQPELVILDEPTTGLDIMAAQTVLEFIRGLKAKGTPVIFSTHHLDEVNELCEKVVVIDQGVSRFEGSLQRFKDLADNSLHQSFMAVIQPTLNDIQGEV